MFDKMRKLILHHKSDIGQADIGPPIPPRPDIPGAPTPSSPERQDFAGFKDIDTNCNQLPNGMQRNSGLEELKSMSYYYGSVEHDELVKIMNPHIYNTGAYIIRKSNSNPEALTISVVHTKSHIYHFKVLPQSNMYEVTKNLKFRTIQEIIEYFQINDIPGSEIQHLKLTTPIKKKRGKARSVGDRPPIKTPPVVPRRVSDPDPIRGRDRQPTPPPTDQEEHKYTVVNSTEEDKLEMIRQLCHEQDLKQQQMRQKCQCGLYYDESMLIHDWMMHRSINPGSCNGRIFFVNQRTNETTWRLPDEIQTELMSFDPGRYDNFQRLQNESQ